MNYSIEAIEGIGPAYKKKLKAAGIRGTKGLLGQCCTRKGRKQMAEKSGISDQLLLNWANKADLMRISGIGPQYSELLEAAGVDTVKELRNRNPENLARKMAEVNSKKRLTRQVPATSKVEGWVQQAKKMDPMMTY